MRETLRGQPPVPSEIVTSRRARFGNRSSAVLSCVLAAACAAGSSTTSTSVEPRQATGSGNSRQVAEKPLVTLPSTAPGSASWTPWPAALHDSRHSGASTETGPKAGTVRWRRKLEGAVTAGPVIGQDGTIYAASNGGVLHALDPATGTDRWTYDSGHTSGSDLSISPLVLPDRTVLWPTPVAELVALSPTGIPLWSQPLPGQPTSPASADGHRVYVGDTSGAVSALDILDAGGHRLVWTVNIGSVSYGSVVTDGTGRLYTTVDTALVAIDDRGATGTVAWRADPHDDITEVSAGLAADGTALLGTNGGREWAYHRDGRPAWNAPRIITYSSPAVTVSGLAYVGDHAGRVHVFDVGNGSEAATYRVGPGQIWSSTVVDRTYRLYFAGQDGHAFGVDSGGTLLFDLDLGAPIDSYPALSADGALIIGARNGILTSVG